MNKPVMKNKLYNVPLEKEDRELLGALPKLPKAWSLYSRPASVSVNWHKTENQGNMGSCRGHSGTSGLERLQYVRNGGNADAVVQLSEIFFYLACQKIDGLLGRDVGSTISAGYKLVLNYGCLPASETGYPSAYPSKSQRSKILRRSNYEAGAPYKAKSGWEVPDDPDAAMNFIGGGGVIDFGCAFWRGFFPADRIIKSYRVPGGRTGGHAMVALGYTESGNILCVNSHGDGEYQFKPNAWRQMIRHKRTSAVGYIGTDEPEPVPWSLW